jgi:serine protease Do
MIKITDKGPFPYAKMGDSDKLKVSEWVISIGHPGGFKPTRSTVVRIGRVVRTTNSIIQTDCTLVGGDSGGPLFDMQGRVVGIHSRIGLPITENVHVPVNTYKDTWERLAKGDSWGGFSLPFFGEKAANPAYLGVVFDRDTTDLKIDEVGEGTPAEKAGLKVGDVIVGMDDAKLKSRSDLFEYMAKKKPNDEVTVVVKRDGEEKKIKVKLGKRPNN